MAEQPAMNLLRYESKINILNVPTTSHSTQLFLGSVALHPPSMKSLRRMVVVICKGPAERQRFLALDLDSDCINTTENHHFEVQFHDLAK